MKICILGSHGMAGHIITKYFKENTKHQIITIARKFINPMPHYSIDIEFKKGLNDLEKTVIKESPNVIINCIGLLVGMANKKPEKAIYINSYFPHWLEKITKNTNTKIIHLSTDCVFSGNKPNGGYIETDIKDGIGFYAQSKSLGEIINNKDLTIRLSIIGPELKINGTGLFHWVMNQSGTIGGYSKAYWNGITTLELAKQLIRILEVPSLTGLYQLAPNFKIDKFSLLKLINTIWNKNLIIKPNDKIIQDKSLINGRQKDYIPSIPSYNKQLEELHEFMEKHNEIYQLLY